ncbi:MAG: cyclic nucleotide-binding domain-containing protein [Nitrospirota bacterium]
MRRLFKWAIDSEKSYKLDIIREVPLFNGLNNNLLRKLLTDLVEKKYNAGDIIFSEGDDGKALYIVMDGSVKIAKKIDSGENTLAVLGPGSYFGELALINQSPRFATAVAEKDSNLLIMYKSYFDDLIKGNSAISSRILLNLVRSLSNYICRNQTIETDN